MTASIPATPKEVGILLTYRCNAECSICCFSCSPQRTETMTRKQVSSYVSGICAIDSVDTVVFSGGEPFLDFELLRFSITEASGRGLRVKVVSNCFWAYATSEAKDRLLTLKQAGLNILEISSDVFHQEFVPIKAVRSAIVAANDLGIAVHLACIKCGDRGLDWLLQTLGDEVAVDRSVEFYVLPVGRAEEARQPANKEQSFPSGRCELIKIPAIDPRGIAYACCGVAGFIPPLEIGRSDDESFAGIVARAEQDPLILGLSVGGPALLAELLEPELRATLPADYIHPCHLCHELLANEDIAGHVVERASSVRLLLEIERSLLLSGQGGMPTIPLPFRDDD